MMKFSKVIQSFVSSGQNISFTDELNKTDFAVFYKNKIADIIVDANDYEVIQIAADLLAGDIDAVTGKKPDILNTDKKLSGSIIIIGSIDRMVLDFGGLKESYLGPEKTYVKQGRT